MIPQPPRLAEWLLVHTLPPGHDALVGDLAEEYVDHVAAYGARRAVWLYWSELIRTILPFFVNGLRWQSTMLKNYLVVAFRNLRKYKGFSAINVLGLAVSMSVCAGNAAGLPPQPLALAGLRAPYIAGCRSLPHRCPPDPGAGAADHRLANAKSRLHQPR